MLGKAKSKQRRDVAKQAETRLFPTRPGRQPHRNEARTGRKGMTGRGEANR
jgi:hypothetical protein